MMPVARRVLGENGDVTLKMRTFYSLTLYMDPGVSLEDLHEAVTTLDDTERIARRVLGSAHPLTAWIEYNMRGARATLRARETPPTPSESG